MRSRLLPIYRLRIRLHTAQPSLSRQIRDLELEVGAQLLIRGPRGIELTPAGRASNHAV
jgi:DNA-binding transcriptional LysR family regulator